MIKGPGVFTGYYKNPEENKMVFDQEGFFRTGDIVKMDERAILRSQAREGDDQSGRRKH